MWCLAQSIDLVHPHCQYKAANASCQTSWKALRQCLPEARPVHAEMLLLLLLVKAAFSECLILLPENGCEIVPAFRNSAHGARVQAHSLKAVIHGRRRLARWRCCSAVRLFLPLTLLLLKVAASLKIILNALGTAHVAGSSTSMQASPG